MGLFTEKVNDTYTTILSYGLLLVRDFNNLYPSDIVNHITNFPNITKPDVQGSYICSEVTIKRESRILGYIHPISRMDDIL